MQYYIKKINPSRQFLLQSYAHISHSYLWDLQKSKNSGFGFTNKMSQLNISRRSGKTACNLIVCYINRNILRTAWLIHWSYHLPIHLGQVNTKTEKRLLLFAVHLFLAHDEMIVKTVMEHTSKTCCFMLCDTFAVPGMKQREGIWLLELWNPEPGSITCWSYGLLLSFGCDYIFTVLINSYGCCMTWC